MVHNFINNFYLVLLWFFKGYNGFLVIFLFYK